MALTPGYFTVGGKSYPAKSLKIKFESLASEDSGRTDDGVMNIGWVYRRLRKLEITLAPCSAQTVSSLFSAVQGQEYSLTYFDPLTNNWRTGTFYTSNSSADLYSGVILNGLYQNVSFNAIELAGE